MDTQCLHSNPLGFFDKAEGSLSRDGEVLFWTGVLRPQFFIPRPKLCSHVGLRVAGEFCSRNSLLACVSAHRAIAKAATRH